MRKSDHLTLWWITRDFRFHDNEALKTAATRGRVLPVVVIDAATRALGAAPRWRLERAIESFNAAWKARTGHEIAILEGEAADLLPALAARAGANMIAQNDWPYAPAQAARSALEERLVGTGVEFALHRGHLLISPEQMLAERGRVYKVYTPFAKALRQIGPELPIKAVEHITAVAPPEGANLSAPLAPDMHGGAPILGRFAQPAGEEAALERLEEFYLTAARYPEGRDRPDLDVCSGLSEALALGEISPRFVWQSAQARAREDVTAASGIQTFLQELMWREFAWHLLIDRPTLPTHPWKPEWESFAWRKSSAGATAWVEGRTGIPLVDAGLREMRVTGRMHNRVRMVVASWLTKHLLTDWRFGLAHFEQSLTDWDPASNAMNWQWVAGCGPDASPFFRIFNPVKQAETFDARGHYRNTWLRPDRSPEAEAYFSTLPSAWQVPRRYNDDTSEQRLREGREAALAALAAHKAAQSPLLA